MRLNMKIEREKFTKQIEIEKEKAAASLREEQKKFLDALTIRYAEARIREPQIADELAIQHAIGVLRVSREGATETEKYFLPRDIRVTAGRSARNDIVLEDPERYISSRHFAFVSKGKDVYLEDFGTNPVRVNGTVESVKGQIRKLNAGDQISIGSYNIRYDRLYDREGDPAAYDL
jgi:hypothetical protein